MSEVNPHTDYAAERARMVEEQLRKRGIQDEAVLRAMAKVPRELFVPYEVRARAYADCALPLAHDQTISQPYMVARALALAAPAPSDTALEVGLGSGYQAAVLAQLCARVAGIELIPQLTEFASQTLRQLGYTNVITRTGDGSLGCPEFAPYDVILVAAAARRVPEALIAQLKLDGRLVIPVGKARQTLCVLKRTETGVIRQEFDHCVYVPLREAGEGTSAPRPPNSGHS